MSVLKRTGGLQLNVSMVVFLYYFIFRIFIYCPQPISPSLRRLRENHGAPPLKLNKDLTAHAQQWADHLAATNTMVHSKQQEYGENIAMKYSSAGTEFSGKILYGGRFCPSIQRAVYKLLLIAPFFETSFLNLSLKSNYTCLYPCG